MKPFIKWAGGKSSIWKIIKPHFPQITNSYIEPFLGGGSVLFNLHSCGMLSKAKKIVASDFNPKLVNVYNSIALDVNGLMTELDSLAGKYSKDFYLKCRDEYNSISKNVNPFNTRCAALFIFLNKTCFNGLYRENKSGGFNVPFGQREKCPELYDPTNLREISEFLHGNMINCNSFEESFRSVQSGDVIYCDPPYIGKFVDYNSCSFGPTELEKLVQLSRNASQLGARVLINCGSNSLADPIFGNIDKVEISTPTSISGHTNAREKFKEYLYIL